MKRMLIIYPNNCLQGAQGTNSRVMQLVKVFAELGFSVDYFGYENFSSVSSFKDFEKQNTEGLINKLYIFDFQKGYKNGSAQKSSKIRAFAERAKRKAKRVIHENYLQDWVPEGAQRLFTDILNENEYDVIVIFYTYMANLLKERNIKAKKIYFMEDSMFLQQYSWDEEGNEKAGITQGRLMDEELERLKFFDDVFCISNDERIFYEKVTRREMYFLPHLLPGNTKKVSSKVRDRKWDVFFIGFDNPFNVEGLNWFLNEVYPLLNNDIKILLVGSATKRIDIKHSNIDIIPFAPDLDAIFESVKISICPMFRGTGMKVKVVESMAKGLPIVCNERGVDGLPDKTMCGCLVTQDKFEFANYINWLCEDEEFYTKTTESINRYYDHIFNIDKYKDLLRLRLCSKEEEKDIEK